MAHHLFNVGTLVMKNIVFALILFIAINAIVFPNAQQEMLAAALIIGALVGLRQRNRFSVPVILFVFTSTTVTMFYVLVGLIRGAPIEALEQAVFIYVVSPILWLIVIDLAWRYLGTERIVNALAYLGILAAATVAGYMFLFLNFGPQAVAFFGSNTNVHIAEGYSGVIMHVSGSLIFLGAAFSAEPNASRRVLLSTMTISSIALAAVASGRTAAILGLLVGASVFFFMSSRQLMVKHLALLLVLAIAAAVATIGLDFLIGVNVQQLMSFHMDKILGGDIERPNQIKALMTGAERTWFLGAGHGIGVDYIRSEFYWRYEAVFIALLYKLGLIGATTVLAPIFLALGIFTALMLKGRVCKYDAFFGSALAMCFFAGFTNPYPEAFVFQWMYLMPVYYFLSARTNQLLIRGSQR